MFKIRVHGIHRTMRRAAGKPGTIWPSGWRRQRAAPPPLGRSFASRYPFGNTLAAYLIYFFLLFFLIFSNIYSYYFQAQGAGLNPITFHIPTIRVTSSPHHGSDEVGQIPGGPELKAMVWDVQVQATESLQESVDTLAAERDSLQRRCQDLQADAARAASEHLETLERLVCTLALESKT